MKKFPWGRIINTFVYDFDGTEATIIKFYPWVYENGRITQKFDPKTVEYYCEEINESSDSLMTMIIAWMVRYQLWHNQ